MSTNLRDKLQKKAEHQKVEAFKGNLSAFTCHHFLASNEIPKAIQEAYQESLRWDTPPSSRIGAKRSFKDVCDWLLAILKQTQLTGTFYLSTPFRFYRWLLCEPSTSSWIENLGETTGFEFCIASQNKDTLIVVQSEEHEIIAHIYQITTT